MFNANKLFQRAPGDPGYREPRPRAHALDATEAEGAREHVQKALNHVNHGEELDVARLRKYLETALKALDAREAEGKDDALQFAPPGSTAEERAAAARGEGEDAEEDDDEEFGPRLGDRDRRSARDKEELGETPAVSSVGLGDRRRRARDAMGETPARSSVSLKGLRRRVDHRDDFRDVASGGAESGADSRHGHDASSYDEATLFQTGGSR